jgi:hypothetical protein
MVSTPNAPDGLFEHIEKEDEETCLYKRLLLDYTYGLGKIYTQEEIHIIGISFLTAVFSVNIVKQFFIHMSSRWLVVYI